MGGGEAAAAVGLLALLLHRDLAYGGIVLPATRARELAEGLVASVDGLRFVVPVRTLDADPNPATAASAGGGD